MGFRNWVTGARPTAAQFMADLEEEGINRCTSSTRPLAANCTDGLHIFETDTRAYLRWDGPPVTGVWVRVFGPWINNTAPVIRQNGSVLAVTASSFRYAINSKVMSFTFTIKTASAGSAGTVDIDLPGGFAYGTATYIGRGEAQGTQVNLRLTGNSLRLQVDLSAFFTASLSSGADVVGFGSVELT
jgi:hypothetical protein